MKGKKEAAFLVVGVFMGLALCGPVQAATAALTATPSTQAIYVDGQQVSMTAYTIGNSNYVRLRDIGQAVGFNVYWDGTVQVESGNPYTGTAPAAQVFTPTQQTPTAITEGSVRDALASLKQTYPTGTVFPTPYRSTSNGPYNRGIHCSGWAALCSDAAFGDLPWRRINRPTWEQIRPGDIVEHENDESYHAVVVLEKTDDYIKVTESGTNNKTRWGGQYFKWWLEGQPSYTLYSRYPE